MSETGGTTMVCRSGEILVVSNDGLADMRVLDRVAQRAQALGADVCMVVPCPDGVDAETAERQYGPRARNASEYLGDVGVYAEWILASTDPVAAVAEAMLVSDAREIMIVTRPVGQSDWLEGRAIERARRFGLPVVHEVFENAPESAWQAAYGADLAPA